MQVIVGVLVLPVLYVSWAAFWPEVMNRVTAHKIKNVPTETYNRLFTDMNPVQLEAAQRYGISPVDDRSFDFDGCKQLTKIVDCKAYAIDNLTHSVPYLTPAAAGVLKGIGEEFHARVKAEGLTECRVLVTSVLRTLGDIQQLSEVNGNVSQNSAHVYGTTFDLSYVRFRTCNWKSWNIYDDRLVEILADVLEEKRREGLCFVRFETIQHCFHITSRN